MCDVWSYGVVLWELFNRQRPYADTDLPIFLLMMSLANGSLRLPPLRPDATSPGLVRLVERCLAWEPTERPSFREVLRLLEAEHRVVRGRGAAMPRSDSANSLAAQRSGQAVAGGAGGSGGAGDGDAPSDVCHHSPPPRHAHHQHHHSAGTPGGDDGGGQLAPQAGGPGGGGNVVAHRLSRTA
eukprot:344173-Chlamydomonas_euryale.AAC.1